MRSVHRILRNFKMPGFTVPEFRRKAVIIAVGGVYDPRIHLDKVVMPVLKKWRIFEREDFTGEAARMRDDLGVLIKELEVPATNSKNPSSAISTGRPARPSGSPPTRCSKPKGR
jgi:Fatty acid desaturase